MNEWVLPHIEEEVAETERSRQQKEIETIRQNQIKEPANYVVLDAALWESDLSMAFNLCPEYCSLFATKGSDKELDAVAPYIFTYYKWKKRMMPTHPKRRYPFTFWRDSATCYKNSYYSVSNVHCGRVKIGFMSSIVFPFIEKPLNDINNSSYQNRYWGADAETNSATYGSSRSSGARKHAGRDLYGTALKTVIVAISDGVVLGNNSFYNGTNEIAILHTTSDGRKFIVRYGEVAPNNVKVKVNDAVKQGQEIAMVGSLNPKVTINGKVTNMLHFEYFTGIEGYNLSKALTQRGLNKYQRRVDLADPLPILLEGYENTFGEKASRDSSKSDDNRIPIMNLNISESGLDFIKSWEGSKMNINKNKHIAYDDSEGYATIGYGHLIAKKKCSSLVYSSSNIVIGGITKEEFDKGITEARSLELLKSDIKSAESGVKKDVTTPLYQQEYDALVSLLYNAGSAFLSKGGSGGGDTKIKKHINNKNYEAGANEFADVTNGGITGLVRRRKAEIKMFKTGIYENNN